MIKDSRSGHLLRVGAPVPVAKADASVVDM